MGRLVVWAAREKVRWVGLAGWNGCLFVLFFFLFFSIPFLSFLFQTFTQNLFKNFRQTFDHTINSKSMHST
jgi:hypothetical protein